VVPSLGLFWANCVNTRVFLSRGGGSAGGYDDGNGGGGGGGGLVGRVGGGHPGVTTLFCSQNTIHMMTGRTVHVTSM
jgi:hypothetical protein